MSNNQLIIADTTIEQDAKGRYCLNDLHKAAVAVGANNRTKEPRKFLVREEVAELMTELTTQNLGVYPVVAKPGRYGGTFVVKELVYAYAMWISAAFHLKVIRAYDNLQTQGIAVADHAAADLLTNPLAYFEKVLAQAKQIQAERDTAITQRDSAIKTIGQSNHALHRVAKTFGDLNQNKIKSDLMKQGFLYQRKGTYRVYAKFSHLFVEKFDETYGNVEIHATEKGKAKIVELYAAGLLTKKVTK